MSTNAVLMGKQSAGFIPEFWSKLLNKKLEKSGAGMKFVYRDWETDRKSTRLNSSHSGESRMPSSA